MKLDNIYSKSVFRTERRVNEERMLNIKAKESRIHHKYVRRGFVTDTQQTQSAVVQGVNQIQEMKEYFTEMKDSVQINGQQTEQIIVDNHFDAEFAK